MYRLCLENNIVMTVDTSEYNLIEYCCMLQHETKTLQLHLSKILQSNLYNKHELINIIMQLDNKFGYTSPVPVDDKIYPNSLLKYSTTTYSRKNVFNLQDDKLPTKELLKSLYMSFNTPLTLLTSFNPSTSNSAISLAAINYQLDLSYAYYPLAEYNHKKNRKHNYTPLEDYFNLCYVNNPNNFSLKHSFNPLFNEDYYNIDDLKTMIYNYGYKDTKDIKDFKDTLEYKSYLYSEMTTIYNDVNWYDGLLTNFVEDHSLISQVCLKDLPFGSVISYGYKNDKLYPITVTDMISQLRTNNCFKTFYDDKYYTANSLRRLLLFLNDKSNYSPEVYGQRQELLQTILLVDKCQKENQQSISNFISSFKVDKLRCHKIISALHHLLHAGFYMRGWLGGSDPYPVEIRDINLELQGDLEIKAQQYIQKFLKTCSKCETLGQKLLKLPLLFFDEQHQTFVQYSQETIIDRINLILKADDNESCIRYSSNLLCWTMYHYINLCSGEHPFAIIKFEILQ